MKSVDFVFWLQGFFELTGNDEGLSLTVRQTDLIRRHLALVFKHDIDPSYGGEKEQEKLNEIHSQGLPPQPGEFTPHGWYQTGPAKDLVVRC